MDDIQNQYGSDDKPREAIQGHEIDVPDYLRVVLKYRWMILLICGAAVVTTVIISLLSPKVYSATTTIVPLSIRKTSSNGNTRFTTDKIYESLIELVEVSGLAKAFLHNRLGSQQGVLRRPQKLPRYSKQLRGYTCDANLRERE